MNGAAQRFIRTAAADIGDTRVDVGVGRLGECLQECSHRHDLPGLAVAALWNALFDPGALYRMVVVRGEAFDGDHLRAIESTDRHRTGAHGGAVDMHRASTALRDTATEFCAGQTDHVAQHPEERRIGLDVDLPGCSVDVDGDHSGSPPREATAALTSRDLPTVTELKPFRIQSAAGTAPPVRAWRSKIRLSTPMAPAPLATI